MKIKFLNDNKVEVIFETNSVYKRPLNERKVYKTQYIIDEFTKRYPKRQIVNVLQQSKVKNFNNTGTAKGMWIFELAPVKQAKPKSVPPVVPKKVTKKKKIKVTKEG